MGKIEPMSDPSTVEVGDQRSYLYAAFDHDTVPPEAASSVGLTVGVRLQGDDTIYTSHHNVASWSVNRDVPAATTVELPLGTTAADVAEVLVTRVPIGTDTGALSSCDRPPPRVLPDRHLPPRSLVRGVARTTEPDAPVAHHHPLDCGRVRPDNLAGALPRLDK